METKDIISASGTIFAIALGIYNFIAAQRAERAHLIVKPKSARYLGKDDIGQEAFMYSINAYEIPDKINNRDTLALEVVNLSKFSVTVDEVGLTLKNIKNRLAVPRPILTDSKEWPRKLEARESITVHFAITELLKSDSLSKVTHAYVHTKCGSEQWGTTRALKQFITRFSK
jgi:hypothetical protein